MKKILIIDDSEGMRKFLNLVLTQNNFETFSAVDGMEGFIAFEQNKPDIVIVDMYLPKMNGREFISKIRSNPQHKKIPIIIVSAYISINEVSDILEVGATYFLRKPISQTDLLSYISRALSFQ